MQQRQFAGGYDRSFMIVSIGMAAVILWMCALVRERKVLKTAVRSGWWLSGICGSFNGITNILGLMCLLVIPGTIYYPVSSAGSLVVTCLLSMTVFREKFTKVQLVGFALGVFAVIFLNITV
jgi:drug/metabolite transporter (DMT)-like permease